MTKKNESRQADRAVQDEQQNPQGGEQQQSEVEKQRLANLKASGQLQEGQQAPQGGETGSTEEGESQK